MSEQKDKCPACKGTGCYMGIDYIGKADVVTCPTCNGTGEKKLDRPDREKIVKILWQGVYDTTKQAEIEDKADQIITVIG